MSTVRFIGLDVHADTIAVAVAGPVGQCGRSGCNLERRYSRRLSAYITTGILRLVRAVAR